MGSCVRQCGSTYYRRLICKSLSTDMFPDIVMDDDNIENELSPEASFNCEDRGRYWHFWSHPMKVSSSSQGFSSAWEAKKRESQFKDFQRGETIRRYYSVILFSDFSYFCDQRTEGKPF